MKVNQLKIREEIEESFKKMMEKQETENESLKKEQNKLRVENAFLKSEFENDKKGHLDDMEDMKARYKRDVEGMKKEKEMQEMEERVDSLNDLKLLKKLQKDNFDLLSKNVLLMRDAKELRQRTSGAGACVCMNPGNQESLLQLNEVCLLTHPHTHLWNFACIQFNIIYHTNIYSFGSDEIEKESFKFC